MKASEETEADGTAETESFRSPQRMRKMPRGLRELRMKANFASEDKPGESQTDWEAKSVMFQLRLIIGSFEESQLSWSDYIFSRKKESWDAKAEAGQRLPTSRGGSKVRPGKPFDEMNGIAANLLLHLTSSMRFEGTLNGIILRIFHSIHFTLSDCSPTHWSEAEFSIT